MAQLRSFAICSIVFCVFYLNESEGKLGLGPV